jgi:predicted dehydrogenase
MARYVDELSAAGVELVDREEQLLGRVDAVFVLSNEGGVHLARSEPFLHAGVPVFVDKPLATSTADARRIVARAVRSGTCVISCSALRWAHDLRALAQDLDAGEIRGADVFAPAPLHDRNPGLFHYGVHGVEMLYALLGPGCVSVSCAREASSEVVVGRWRDGRIGVLRGLRADPRDYGVTIHRGAGVTQRMVDTAHVYTDLLAAVVPALAERTWLIPADELVEVVAFQSAALRSAEDGGRVMQVADAD